MAVDPVTAAVTSGGTQVDPALLTRVVERMNASGGFPALEHSVTRIIEALEAGAEDAAPLINAVLADVSLTQKVLRLANSAMYAPIGGSVATISHAMMVLGFEAIGHLALGAKVIGSMEAMDAQSLSARRQLAHSLMAGSVAGNVTSRMRVQHAELGVVCALLHRVGRLLTAFYLPEEWTRIQQLVQSGRDEAAASRDVLGLTLEQLGATVARHWRLPHRIVLTMRGELDGPVQGVEDWLLAVTRYADSSAAVLSTRASEDIKQQLQARLALRFADRLGVACDDLLSATHAALLEPCAAMLLSASGTPPADAHEPARAPSALDKLRDGETEIRAAIEQGGTPADIAGMVVEVIYRALDLSRAAVFLLDETQQAYRVRATLAMREPNALVGLTLPAQFSRDLAHVALARRADIYIDNPRDGEIAPHLPAWIRAHALHPFFLLPMTAADGNALGLLFGQQQDDVKLTKAELATLATLRNLLQARLTGAR